MKRADTVHVGLSPAGQHCATGIAAALASFFVKSPALKSACAKAATEAFTRAAEELRRARLALEGK